ncbi:DNA invertase Pin-like site-specific DNA recombinase [Geobacillus thermodenitrificans]|jgi:site-specific DNA recombinase|uniref:recombinase family protein n=1 Tax=Geobacillus thermodenitrificans TaxID=33940 RepID=UPI002DFC73DA|nr:recombinase family protein [Geobacillus thermodenitrificans]MEC5188784.1 DNA invertase Pin-like site-specific DNA recombinase [Geobacillus thermodenitrificans]
MIGIYVRSANKDDGQIKKQLNECYKLIKNEPVKEYVDIGETGLQNNFPVALQELNADIGKGLIKKVVCYSPDRISRNKTDIQMFVLHCQRNGVDLQFVDGTNIMMLL